MAKQKAKLSNTKVKVSKIKDTPHNVKFNAREHWRGMPEFTQKALAPYQKVIVNLVDEVAALRFFKLLGILYTKKTRSIWFPKVEEDRYMDKRYSDTKKKAK